MCVISMLADTYQDRWREIQPQIPPWPQTVVVQPGISREEFEQLRAEVTEMKELLRAAKRIDELTGQADCHEAEKLEILRRIAALFEVSLDDVL